jgi:hypothetical protein
MGVDAAIIDAHFVFFMPIKFGDEHLHSLKHNSGVYKIIINDKWYYIGSSVNLRNRLASWKHTLQGGSEAKNRSIKYILPEVRVVRFEILKYTKLGEDHRAIEDLYIKKHYEDQMCLNLCASAYSSLRKGYNKIPLGTIPKPPKKKGQPTPNKKVAQFDLGGNLIKIHKSIGEASRITGIKTTTIRKTFNGRQVKPRGFIFKGVNDDGSFIEPNIISKLRPKDVRFIVDNYRTIGNAKLREMYGLCESHVRAIAMGEIRCGVACDIYNSKMPIAPPKKIIRIGLSGLEIIFKSIGEAARSINARPSSIQRALLPGNEHRAVGGYRFRHA